MTGKSIIPPLRVWFLTVGLLILFAGVGLLLFLLLDEPLKYLALVDLQVAV